MMADQPVMITQPKKMPCGVFSQADASMSHGTSQYAPTIVKNGASIITENHQPTVANHMACPITYWGNVLVKPMPPERMRLWNT